MVPPARRDLGGGRALLRRAGINRCPRSRRARNVHQSLGRTAGRLLGAGLGVGLPLSMELSPSVDGMGWAVSVELLLWLSVDEVGRGTVT